MEHIYFLLPGDWSRLYAGLDKSLTSQIHLNSLHYNQSSQED